MKPTTAFLALACILSMATTTTFAAPEPDHPVAQGVFLENSTLDAQTIALQAPAQDIEFASSSVSTEATAPVHVLQASMGSSIVDLFVQQECCGGTGWGPTPFTKNLFAFALLALVSWFVWRFSLSKPRKTFRTAV